MHLTDAEARKYQCPLCQLCFKRSCHLTAHYRSKTHESEKDKVAELLKQGVRANVAGPIVIPQKNKFKNHALWTKSASKSKVTKKKNDVNNAANHVRHDNTPSETSITDDAVPVPTVSSTSNCLQSNSSTASQIQSNHTTQPHEFSHPFPYTHHFAPHPNFSLHPTSHSSVLNSNSDNDPHYFGFPHWKD